MLSQYWRLTKSKLFDHPEQFNLFAFVGIAVMQFVVQVTALTKGVEYIAVALTDDDTYYYLQIAWNTKQLGYSTFDGIHPTNGVQLLWYWLVTLLALFASTKIILLFATLTFAFLLNALGHLIIWKIGETLQLPVLSVYMSSLWLLLSFGARTYSTGMENSLHALVFWGVVWQVTKFLIRVQRNERPHMVSLTIVLILNVWTRLDGAIFSAILYVYCLVRALKTEALKLSIRRDIAEIITSILLAVVGLLIQLGTFRLAGGSYLPVSSLVKRGWANWDKVQESLMTLGTPSNLPGGIGPVALVIILLFTLLGLHWIKQFNHANNRLIVLESVWLCLLSGVFLHLVITAGIGAYHLYRWYLSPAYIFSIITLSIILYSIQNTLAKRGFITLSRLAMVAVCLLFVAASFKGFIQRLVVFDPLNSTRHTASRWMAENLPSDAVCASWNAGQVGYFSGRIVINLDGLVNSIDYYNRVITGPLSWQEYINENDVDCIADYRVGGLIVPGYSTVQKFPFNDGTHREFLILQAQSSELPGEP